MDHTYTQATSTIAAPGAPQTTRQRRRRLSAALLGVALVGLLLWLAIPSTRRWLANPTGHAPKIGVTQILVHGDLLQNHVFEPAVVRVPVGTTITWTFADRGAGGQSAVALHNVVGPSWASAVIGLGSYQHTFSAPGVYRYTCTLHPNMDGVVEVVAADALGKLANGGLL